MSSRDSRPDMGELVDKLEDEAIENAVGVPSNPPASDSGIDPDKLLRAWVLMTDVQKQLVRVSQKTEGDNQSTRKHNTWTRVVMLVSVLGVAAVGYNYSEENNALLKEVRASQLTTAEDNAQTLRAVRAVAEAVGAKIEAETTMHPGAEEDAREAAVEAQEEALSAEVVVATDPSARADAVAKLINVRKRKAHGRADPVMPGKPIERDDHGKPIFVEETELVDTGKP